MDALQKAIKERDDFLKKHPKHKEYQKEIDYIFKQIGNNPEARLEAIAQMVEGQMLRLQFEVYNLNQILEEKANNTEN
jgi:hypothetical protein